MRPRVIIQKFIEKRLKFPREFYHVIVEREDGFWEETCGTMSELNMFIRGVEAGTNSHIKELEIPKNAQII